jgi:hypothetical protein
MELMDRESSLLSDLSMQQVSIQKYPSPSRLAWSAQKLELCPPRFMFPSAVNNITEGDFIGVRAPSVGQNGVLRDILGKKVFGQAKFAIGNFEESHNSVRGLPSRVCHGAGEIANCWASDVERIEGVASPQAPAIMRLWGHELGSPRGVDWCTAWLHGHHMVRSGPCWADPWQY